MLLIALERGLRFSVCHSGRCVLMRIQSARAYVFRVLDIVTFSIAATVQGCRCVHACNTHTRFALRMNLWALLTLGFHGRCIHFHFPNEEQQQLKMQSQHRCKQSNPLQEVQIASIDSIARSSKPRKSADKGSENGGCVMSLR